MRLKFLDQTLTSAERRPRITLCRYHRRDGVMGRPGQPADIAARCPYQPWVHLKMLGAVLVVLRKELSTGEVVPIIGPGIEHWEYSFVIVSGSARLAGTASPTEVGRLVLNAPLTGCKRHCSAFALRG